MGLLILRLTNRPQVTHYLRYFSVAFPTFYEIQWMETEMDLASNLEEHSFRDMLICEFIETADPDV